ncbi:MAG: hypothetical protein KGM91_08610, partial [Burkholderiales bacterium]|nr:hypothetical protein [Burkholderiales bacterium]
QGHSKGCAMSDPEERAFASEAVLPISIGEMKAAIKTSLIPLAHETRVLQKSDGPQELLEIFWGLRTDDLEPQEPKQIAAMNVITVVGLVQLASNLFRMDKDSEWGTFLVECRRLTNHAYGYLCALRDVQRATVRRGADGRRSIGDTTKKRIRVAAHEVLSDNPDLSKERAAPIIGNLVGKSPSTVRGLLSKMFSAEEWEALRNASMDSLQHDDG